MLNARCCIATTRRENRGLGTQTCTQQQRPCWTDVASHCVIHQLFPSHYPTKEACPNNRIRCLTDTSIVEIHIYTQEMETRREIIVQTFLSYPPTDSRVPWPLPSRAHGSVPHAWASGGNSHRHRPEGLAAAIRCRHRLRGAIWSKIRWRGESQY